MPSGRSTEDRVSRVSGLLGDAVPGARPPASSLFTVGSFHNNGPVTINVYSGAAAATKPDTDRNRRLAGIRARVANALRGQAKLDAYLYSTFNGLPLDALDDAAVEQVYSWSFSLLVRP